MTAGARRISWAMYCTCHSNRSRRIAWNSPGDQEH